jgi:crotonobetainyl-CoA:carnitine CoA-transferase CaiB-like acyl-CoA transferase
VTDAPALLDGLRVIDMADGRAEMCGRYLADLGATLQAAGVPAGMMERVQDQRDDPHLVDRDFFRPLTQPGLDTPVITERGPCKARNLPDPPLEPAPIQGQHTFEVARHLLDLDYQAIDDLVERGVLELAEDATIEATSRPR